MSNQLSIAKKLGLSQATVSRALKNSPLISEKTRLQVLQASNELGYKPNPMVVSLMNRIRSGRSIDIQACIGIMDTVRVKIQATPHDTWARQNIGIMRRADALGFRTEYFFIEDYGMNSRKLERLLQARNIQGLIISARDPNCTAIDLDWSRYASATISYNRMDLGLERASINHRGQMDRAMSELLERGYKRIGVCLPRMAAEGDDIGGVHGAWMDRYLFWQHRLRHQQPLPLLIGSPNEISLTKARSWLKRHKIDALLGLIGHEKKWLDAMKLRMPQDIGLVCLNRPLDSDVSGMDENHEMVGEITAELVINRILHNDFGLSKCPKLIFVDGVWREGLTLRPRN